MKGLKGRFLKKLSFMPTITTLKQGLVLQLHQPEVVGSVLLDKITISQHVKAFEDREEMDHRVSVSDTETESDSDQDLPFLDAETEILESDTNCPPGGRESVIFYTTSFRGIRKTYEDCNTIRFLLESFRVMFHERDVSMSLEFREELWRVLGGSRVIPPRLFIKGRCVGGAEEVVALHEQGKLRELMDGLPLDLSNGPCRGCGNLRFVVCSYCNGSCKIVVAEEEEGHGLCTTRCPKCNENGLAKCPFCH